MNNLNLLQKQLALSFLKGIGSIRARHLVNHCASVSDVFELPYQQLHIQTGIPLNLLKNMQRKRALDEAEKYLPYFEDRPEISCTFLTDANFPRRLKQCDDAPLILFNEGKWESNPSKTLAIVGTRNPTAYGKKVCEEFIEYFRGSDIQVVSGMAYGIDIWAHQLCVKEGIETLGVLGHGLDILYPNQHQSTAQKMKQNGALLSEFLPYTNPDRENFPRRNRIVAGLTDATLVIESKAKGGSLITARLANDYNREVFAVPGRVGEPFSEGCNLLIAQDQAHLYQGPEAFAKLMGWNKEGTPIQIVQNNFEDLNPNQRHICQILSDHGPLHLDLLTERSQRQRSDLGLILFELEMLGMVRSLPGMLYGLTA